MTVLVERDSIRGSVAPIAAVLETLAYSDVFDYPLRLEELWRYLSLPIGLQDLRALLDAGIDCVSSKESFYFLEGREHLVALRKRREAISRSALRRAMWFGRVLGSLPFIRMVAVTGSLAVLNSERDGDLDYMLVTEPGRVWMARGFALFLGRLTALIGYTICPNLIVSENALEWTERDLYNAREICQMIPIAGMHIYDRLRRINDWTKRFLPNALEAPIAPGPSQSVRRPIQRLLEWPFRGDLGDRLEHWEMKRKIRRFTHQPGFGIETRFDADVCQGNFLHHAAQTRRALQERLARLGVDSRMLTSQIKPH